MNEDHINQKAKKIRNKLIYFIHSELTKKLKDTHLLINSLTSKELNDKYQKCSDYCVEKIETYSSSQMNNGIDNNNYFHVSLTYNSLNNNYHMLIDNRNIDQMIGKNNIVGKYYKGNSVHIRTTTDKNNYNVIFYENENKFQKIGIGNKKFIKKRKLILSSFAVNKNISFIDNEKSDNNEDNNYLDNINSNFNNNYKNLINININNENKKVETICAKILRKAKNQKIINLYSIKLKKYCSTLKILKNKGINNSNQLKNSKLNELPSPSMNENRKNFRKGYSIRSGKDKPKMLFSIFTKRESKDFNHQRYKTENQLQIQNNNKIKQQNYNSLLKSQTKINQNLFKIPEKKSAHRRNRAQSIDKMEEKCPSPKKMINNVKANNIDKYGNLIFQKNNKKNKEVSNSIKKYISGGIISKRKMFTNNANFKSNNNNVIVSQNTFKKSQGILKKTVNKNFKRANTGINKYHFRGNEIKFKDNNF